MSDPKIICNSARCSYCPVELESTHRHDFKRHVCVHAGRIAKSYNHELKCYEPDYPSFAVDGGRDYVRRVFTRKQDYIETSQYE